MLDAKFAFVIHPIQIKKDVARKYPILGKVLTEPMINWASQFFPPLYISHVTGLISQETGRETTGWLLAVPFTPPTMLSLPHKRVYRKIIGCGKMAEKLGAHVLGLGAFTSVVGDAGITVAQNLDIAVTTGDSYTVAVGVQSLFAAAEQMGITTENATVAVVGATGAIGKASAQLIARRAAKLVLVGRRQEATDAVRELCQSAMRGRELVATTDMNAIYAADLVLTATSAVGAVIEPQHLKPGAVVLDLARPLDVSVKVARQREDVLVIEGGIVEVPGAAADFHFDFGLPPRRAFACMAETITLAMEGLLEDYTIGRDLELARIERIEALATKHGFALADLRSFDRSVSPEAIARTRQRAEDARKTWQPKPVLP